MRLIIFFDLPSVTNEEKKNYRHFIKLLKTEGFYMMQESVYTKLAVTPYVTKSTINSIQKNLPPCGHISALTVTEKQFNDICLLLGGKKSEVIDSVESILEL